MFIAMTNRRGFLGQTAAIGISAAIVRPAAGVCQRAGVHEPSTHVVQTVLGALDASKLGCTLSHEHVSDGPYFLNKWPKGGRVEFTSQTVNGLKRVRAAGISANRNLESYAAFGVPVWPDTLAGYPGPLAGFLAGLTHCQTPLLVTVPCDTPFFPVDLVVRLRSALVSEGTDIAMACAPEDNAGLRPQPVFCLMRRSLAEDLEDFIRSGGRRAHEWSARHPASRVAFDRDCDAGAFANANTPQELGRLGLTGKPSVS